MLTDHWPWSILLFVMPSPLLRYSFVNILYRRSNSHEVSTIKQKWCNNPEFLECVKILKTRHSKEILMLNSQFKYFTRSTFGSIVHSWIYICIYGILRSILSWISMTQLKYNNYLYFATKISKYCFKDFKYNPLLCHHISWYYTDMSPYPLIWCWYVRLKMRLHSPSKFLTPCASSLVAPSPIFLCIFHHMSIRFHHMLIRFHHMLIIFYHMLPTLLVIFHHMSIIFHQKSIRFPSNFHLAFSSSSTFQTVSFPKSMCKSCHNHMHRKFHPIQIQMLW